MRIVNQQLLKEFRYVARCEFCKRPSQGCDPHHLRCKGMGGGSRLDVRCNLIALDRLCHSEFHAGNIAYYDLLAIVAAREGVNQRDIEAVVNLILRLPKDCRPWQLDQEREQLNIASQLLLDRTLKETTR